MKNYLKTALTFVVMMTVAAIVGTVTMRGQSQKESLPGGQEVGAQKQHRAASKVPEAYDESSYPVTDYAAPEAIDLEHRALGRARRKRHNNNDPGLKRDQIGRFAITEQTDSSFGGFPSHARSQPALPAGQSDVIVIGNVREAEAHLSEDKTDIYSEFTVQVENVLKDAVPAQLPPHTAISVIRSGGAVRFPSGKKIRRGFDGKPFPRIGRRYVLFLRYNKEEQDYSVITGYELRAGQVFPLDGLSMNGTIIPELAEHQKYKGASEANFLDEVLEAIARVSVNELERR